MPAASACFFIILNIDWRLIRPPNLFRNRISSSAGVAGSGRLSIYSLTAFTAISPIGTRRSLSPFPMTRTKPSSKYIEDIRRSDASETLRPEPYSISRMALSRMPCQEDISTDSIIATTSSTASTSGRYLPSLGESTLSQGLSRMTPSMTSQLKNERSELSTRAWVRLVMSFLEPIYISISSVLTSSGLQGISFRKADTSEQYDATVFCDIARSILR